MEVLVDHEVEAEELEVVGEAVGVEEEVAGFYGVCCDFAHLGEDWLLESKVSGFVVYIKVLLELGVAYFVAFLEFSIVFRIFLDSVVG